MFFPSKCTLIYGLTLFALMSCADALAQDDEQVPARELLRISELMPINRSVIRDEAGETDDWIELVNLGDQPLNLRGYGLSDKVRDEAKVVLEVDLVIEPGGFLILWADGQPEQGPNHLPFRLSGAGESVTLFNPDGALIDVLTWVDAWPDYAYGRSQATSSEAIRCGHPTPGAANASPCWGAGSPARGDH